MKDHYPKLYNMAHVFSLNIITASKGSNNYILFAITAAGVVPCGGPKKSPRTSSIVQIIFFCWSFEISENIWSISNTLYVKNHHLNRILKCLASLGILVFGVNFGNCSDYESLAFAASFVKGH